MIQGYFADWVRLEWPCGAACPSGRRQGCGGLRATLAGSFRIKTDSEAIDLQGSGVPIAANRS